MRMTAVPCSILLIGLMVPLCASAQQWNSHISVASRIGYTTNSYLNDYLSEWEPTLAAPYWMVSPRMRIDRHLQSWAFTAGAGLHLQPYLKKQYGSWEGGYARVDINRRWSRSLITGFNAGLNRYHFTYSRTLAWAQPYLRWNLSDQMEMTLQYDATYRSYSKLASDTNSNRYNRMSLHLQYWPSYRWQLQTGMYTNFQQWGDGGQSISGYASTSFWPRNDLKLTLQSALERYGFEVTSKRRVRPRCDVRVGCSVDNRIIITNRDKIYRLELSGSYQINPRWSISLSSAYMKWISSGRNVDQRDHDLLLSAGVSYSITPDWGGREEVRQPEIHKRSDQKVLFTVRYRGEGRLYLTGDFNNWRRPGIPLIEGTNNQYRTLIKLDRGAYEYKILKIEGGEQEWLKLGNKTVMVEDGFGGLNGRMVIE